MGYVTIPNQEGGDVLVLWVASFLFSYWYRAGLRTLPCR